ncbi:hypothetical protein F5X71_28975 [Nocardia brasiliensis]|uniref:Uncharacterized protein n=1 Tax=Nocardia brasiliensis TaxID=37326 RepID=A0A6G9XY15_NOCBR|nr:hypothetical protein [Nocardia brasiliensis]QIS05801.1 hypothetical protein F5X71_28975 [Nocardia brasiliensis]
MPAQPRVRSMIVALLGTFALACAVVAPGSAVAQAAPPTVIQIDGATESPDKKADKAEKLGGGLVNKVIDLTTGAIKCGLNIALPSVKCSL